VVNFNGGHDLCDCLRSLQSQTLRASEVIVVDNASTDQSLQNACSQFPAIIPIANSVNAGFAAGANQGAQAATGDVLLFLNPDVSLSPDCLHQVCLTHEQSPGVVGLPLSIGADAEELYGCTIDRLGYSTTLQGPGQPLYVAGAALATSRSIFEQLGGFDERYFMFVEDVDYCWRVLLSGFQVGISSEAYGTHRGGGVAPGGYVRSGRLETTAFRFVLRERNAFATLLKCAPMAWLAWLFPAYIAKTGLLIGGALSIRRIDLARGLLLGLVWNFRQLRRTNQLRRKIHPTESGKRAAAGRIYKGSLAVERLRQFGVPHFVDTQRVAHKGVSTQPDQVTRDRSHD
jgi:GT2 family glycosyltransferase